MIDETEDDETKFEYEWPLETGGIEYFIPVITVLFFPADITYLATKAFGL